MSDKKFYTNKTVLRLENFQYYYRRQLGTLEPEYHKQVLPYVERIAASTLLFGRTEIPKIVRINFSWFLILYYFLNESYI